MASYEQVVKFESEKPQGVIRLVDIQSVCSEELCGLGELGVMQKGSTAVLAESLTQSPRSPQSLGRAA